MSEELSEAREAGRLLQVQVQSLQDKASLAEEHLLQLKEARDARDKAESELAAASHSVGELEAQVRDAQVRRRWCQAVPSGLWLEGRSPSESVCMFLRDRRAASGTLPRGWMFQGAVSCCWYRIAHIEFVFVFSFAT